MPAIPKAKSKACQTPHGGEIVEVTDSVRNKFVLVRTYTAAPFVRNAHAT